jgi:hypothetical protein
MFRICLSLVTLLALSSGVQAGEAGLRQHAISLPGGTADPAGRTGFVTGPDGHIDAINLKDGKLRWKTKVLCHPLIAYDGKLAAWVAGPGKANQILIRIFDATQDGKRVRESDPVIFPAWVSVGLTHGRTFSLTTEGIVKGKLVLHWDARAFYAGGAAPPPQVVAASRKHAAGTARVNLASGKVEMLSAKEGDAGTGPKLPPGREKVTSRQYWTGSNWETKLLVAGKVLAALQQQKADGQKEKLVLKRWDRKTGKALEPVALLEGQALWLQVQPGGNYVFVHQALVKTALPPGDYAWWIFSLETGKQVGKVPFEAGTQSVAVIGSRAFFLVPGQIKARPGGRPFFGMEQPRALKAYALASGRLLWERPVEPIRRLPPPP